MHVVPVGIPEIHLHGNAVMIVEWANASVTTPLSDEQLRALCGTSFAPGMLKAVPSTASPTAWRR